MLAHVLAPVELILSTVTGIISERTHHSSPCRANKYYVVVRLNRQPRDIYADYVYSRA